MIVRPFEPSPVRFRVWDGYRMRYPEDEGACEVGSELTLYPDGALVHWVGPLLDDPPVMLSTGLRDEAGREIWDGDVLRWHDKAATVTTDRGAWVAVGLIDPDGGPARLSLVAPEAVVVGNAYEHQDRPVPLYPL